MHIDEFLQELCFFFFMVAEVPRTKNMLILAVSAWFEAVVGSENVIWNANVKYGPLNALRFT